MKATELAGRPFPNVALQSLDGKRQRILGAAGSWKLVAVGHSDCATTRLVVPYLKRMQDRRAGGASVVLVLQDSPQAARAFLSELGADLPVRLEAEPYPLSAALGLGTVPTLFLVSPAGIIEHVCEGFQRAAVEDFAGRLGVKAPFFTAADKAPALRPG